MASVPGFKVTNRLLSAETANKSSLSHLFFRLVELITHFCWFIAVFSIRLLWNKLMRRQRDSWQALLGHSLTELCASLGATFIKMGQILSTRRDLIPPAMAASLAKLQDDVRPFPFRYVPVIMQAELGQRMEEIFAEFEEQPIASASVASVYRARLHNGQWVAVKVRRPDIVRKVSDDLRLMRIMARGLACLPVLKLIPIVEMIDELGTCIEQQLDLRIEARNTQLFREQFASNPRVQFAELIEEYCCQGVLVMEFIDGLVRIDQLDWEEAEYRESLITGLRALYHMIFLAGFIHCDLHPGNLYLRKGGQVVILDTGFIAKMTPLNRRQFADFFLGISTNGGKKCARIIYETALYKPKTFDQEGFEREVVELIAQSAGSKADTFQVAPFAARIFDIERRFGLRGSIAFTMAILALLVFEGIAKQLYPHLDFQAEAKPFILDALLQRQPDSTSSY